MLAIAVSSRRFCHSVWGGGGGSQATIAHNTWQSASPYRDPFPKEPHPEHVVHYESHTVGNRGVVILVGCFLVFQFLCVFVISFAS